MKNFFEKLKDFIYDYIDFITVILVIILIGAIIFWRLDILFTDTEVDNPSDENNTNIQEPIEENNPNDEKEDKNNNSDENEENQKDENEEISTDTEKDSSNDVEINIEAGSSSESIADTLLSNNIINDKREFLLRLSDLGLETKLRPGTFVLKQNDNIDTIIKTLANQI